jgi:hypothetical protein
LLQDGNAEQDRLDQQQQMEQQFWDREPTLPTKKSSRRKRLAPVPRQRHSLTENEPNAQEGYDPMWVSAIDNACFKSLLVGNFRHYGIEFADNY